MKQLVATGRFLARYARRIKVTFVGGLLLLAGLVLTPVPLPIPFVVLIPAGLIVLSLEFPFAERLLNLIETKTGRFGRVISGMNRRARNLAIRMLGAPRTHRPDDIRKAQTTPKAAAASADAPASSSSA